MDDEEELRRNEEESRRIAQSVEGEENKKAWLRLAEWWRLLRERMDRRSQ